MEVSSFYFRLRKIFLPSMMMQMMKSMRGGEKEGEKGEPCMPTMETQEGFKPWEFCPCRKLCEEVFKKKQ